LRPLRGGGRPPVLSAAGRAVRAGFVSQLGTGGRGWPGYAPRNGSVPAPEGFMSAGTGQASGSPSARAPAGAGSAADAAAAAQEGTWHHRLVELADGWPWIRTLNDQLTAVLGPWREKYQGHPVLELMHGGR